METTNTFYNFFVGGALAYGAYLIGGYDHLLISLIIFMTADYLLGLMCGYQNKDLSSKKSFNGIMKKTAMLLAIVVAYQLDTVVGDSSKMMRQAMIFFLIGTEGLSIVENLGRLGIKMPDKIAQVFKQFGDNGEEKIKK